MASCHHSPPSPLVQEVDQYPLSFDTQPCSVPEAYYSGLEAPLLRHSLGVSWWAYVVAEGIAGNASFEDLVMVYKRSKQPAAGSASKRKHATSDKPSKPAAAPSSKTTPPASASSSDRRPLLPPPQPITDAALTKQRRTNQLVSDCQTVLSFAFSPLTSLPAFAEILKPPNDLKRLPPDERRCQGRLLVSERVWRATERLPSVHQLVAKLEDDERPSRRRAEHEKGSGKASPQDRCKSVRPHTSGRRRTADRL